MVVCSQGFLSYKILAELATRWLIKNILSCFSLISSVRNIFVTIFFALQLLFYKPIFFCSSVIVHFRGVLFVVLVILTAKIVIQLV